MAKEHKAYIEELAALRQPAAADDPIAEAGRKVLLVELIKMLQNESGSRTGEDTKPVHDMRVAIRRMRSTMTLLEPYFKQKALSPYLKSLRKIARTLGTVRDLDVLIENLHAYAESQPEETRVSLEKTFALLDKRRSAARERLNHTFDRGSYQRFIGDFGTFLTTSGKGVRTADSDSVQPVALQHILPEMIYRHVGAVRAYAGVIDDAELATLHALRIEFKRLRYVVALFGDVLGSTAKSFIEELKLIQDHLGKLNDLEVARDKLTDLMSDFSPKTDADVQIALQAYIAVLEAEHKALYESFTPVWNHFNTKKVQRHIALAVAGL